jgi:hypothetical protein
MFCLFVFRLIAKYKPESKLTVPIFSGEWGYSTAWYGMNYNDSLISTYIVREFFVNMANEIPVSIWLLLREFFWVILIGMIGMTMEMILSMTSFTLELCFMITMQMQTLSINQNCSTLLHKP